MKESLQKKREEGKEKIRGMIEPISLVKDKPKKLTEKHLKRTIYGMFDDFDVEKEKELTTKQKKRLMKKNKRDK